MPSPCAAKHLLCNPVNWNSVEILLSTFKSAQLACKVYFVIEQLWKGNFPTADGTGISEFRHKTALPDLESKHITTLTQPSHDLKSLTACCAAGSMV